MLEPEKFEHGKHFRLRAEEKGVDERDKEALKKPVHEFIISKVDPLTGESIDIVRSQDISELTFLIEQEGITLEVDNNLMEYLVLRDQATDVVEHQSIDDL